MTQAPLADRMRPQKLEELVGQKRWLGSGGMVRQLFDEGRLHSMVFWGPPGCGKTTLARIIADHSNLLFIQLSAVLDGVKELRGVLERAEVERKISSRGTLLFVDEIHRWNKAQQDALLPQVESGGVILVGATTENPSFQLIGALRSRVQTIRLDPLDPDDIRLLLDRALVDPRGLGEQDVSIDDEALAAIARVSAGDARQALSDLERCASAHPGHLTVEIVQQLLQRSDIRHDRAGEDHYNVVSALIKSMRGSDPDAAVYWLARMLSAGEDPLFIARRLIIFATEDIGNADPRSLPLAVAAAQAVQMIGMPEGRIPLAQAVTWLATSPKSNASYVAIGAALADVQRYGALPVPLHLRQATAADRDYGMGYLYPHDHPHRIVKQQYLPEELSQQTYYEPTSYGEEKTIGQRLEWWRRKLEK